MYIGDNMKNVLLVFLMLAMLIITNGCGKQIQVNDGITAPKPFDPNAMCASDSRCTPFCGTYVDMCLLVPHDQAFCEVARQECLDAPSGDVFLWFMEPWPGY